MKKRERVAKVAVILMVVGSVFGLIAQVVNGFFLEEPNKAIAVVGVCGWVVWLVVFIPLTVQMRKERKNKKQ